MAYQNFISHASRQFNELIFSLLCCRSFLTTSFFQKNRKDFTASDPQIETPENQFMCASTKESEASGIGDKNLCAFILISFNSPEMKINDGKVF